MKKIELAANYRTSASITPFPELQLWHLEAVRGELISFGGAGAGAVALGVKE